jgi:hypothetical protein
VEQEKCPPVTQKGRRRRKLIFVHEFYYLELFFSYLRAIISHGRVCARKKGRNEGKLKAQKMKNFSIRPFSLSSLSLSHKLSIKKIPSS